MKGIIFLIVIIISPIHHNAQNRIKYNNQNLFLNGTNLAWINFANDVGKGQTNYEAFADLFLTIHDNGGNAVRWWLHTDGTTSPKFDSQGMVIGTGEMTISEIRKVLDLAWEREVGIKLCLWSFDMLRSSNGLTVIERNSKMLTDTNYTRAYINNCLIPMIDSLKGHPGIIAWEIFNEPEGMSNEFGWSFTSHVSMSAIQRFINLCAGAIHRTDPSALVTNGAWSFQVQTDVVFTSKISLAQYFASLSYEQKKKIEKNFYAKYGWMYSVEELFEHLSTLPMANLNYYSDERLISAGGDKDGTLDFYSVHYYQHLGTQYSPFAKSISYWKLDKPVVVGEFHMATTDNIPTNLLYQILHAGGYAGALAWSWTDNTVSKQSDILAGIKSIRDKYPADVDVDGISGDWPTISITNPKSGDKFPAGSEILITANAFDKDGTVTKVEFLYDTSIKIGESIAEPYSYLWKNIPEGEHKLYCVVTDNIGNKRKSDLIIIQIGAPTLSKFEAENAQRTGSDITIAADAAASNGQFLNIRTNVGTITWQLYNASTAGNYEIVFGYRLAYNTPKNQFLNINGNRVTKVEFVGLLNTWLEKSINVELTKGPNTIQMEMEWGWMHLDYLAVPASLFTSVNENEILPDKYNLFQNYPNPFNPTTTIKFSIPEAGQVKLVLYDLLGREAATLIDNFYNSGNYEVELKGSNLTSGVYFYTMSVNGFRETKKLLLLK